MGQNGQEDIRNEKIIVIYVLHVMTLNFVIHVEKWRLYNEQTTKQ